jgi:hypothetical protein
MHLAVLLHVTLVSDDALCAAPGTESCVHSSTRVTDCERKIVCVSILLVHFVNLDQFNSSGTALLS